MVSRVLAAIMLVQVLAAWLLWHLLRTWLAPLHALLAALLLVALVRMLIVANNFHMSWRARSETPAQHGLDWRGSLRLFFGEFAASMRASSWTMLWYRPGIFIADEARGLPVLLIHGYGCNGGYWYSLRALLRQRRISHDAVDLEPMTADIDSYVEQVAQGVQRLLAATGQRELVLVGHSMGGLVGRAYLRKYGWAHVARLVTLGTPHHGTALASLGLGENARQMRRGGDWLASLNADDTKTRSRITSIWSHHDNIIAPQDSCALPGAKNIEVGGIGHVALGSDKRTLLHVLDEVLTNSTTSARLS
ncbi:esterase/lipase family protein [Massilia endophytica]|uniref:esterase/lipase family protein n=1 Tax=Massilia endophytica TaxID=2899220 RepID=UPI001E33EFB5|nr:alpha/beta fold hydrolase [Massilia endophytica]UGQ47880.1 alpha/beta fold hydrolase [Massilia endophytica]